MRKSIVFPTTFRRLTAGDLFCGAGGGSTGLFASGYVDVVFCINHDKDAIRSHEANYPQCKHYTEDIRSFDEHKLPQVDILIVSAECTNFSKAKGGRSREADSRTLAEEIYRYIDWCNPSIIIVENVEEFMMWSPLVQKLDSEGNPVMRSDGTPYLVPDTGDDKIGCDYLKWVQTIKSKNYSYQSRILNSADYGAYTARKRFYGIFVREGMVIKFPQPTHAKKPPIGSPIHKWKPCRDLLDLEDKGASIFDRKKPLVKNTLKRILAGLEKYVPQEKEAFIVKFLSNNAKTGINAGADVDVPLHTITTQGRMAVCMIDSYKTRADAIHSANDAMRTLDTLCNKGLVTVECATGAFIDVYYGTSVPQSIDAPLRTITTVERHAKVDFDFVIEEEVISKRWEAQAGDCEVMRAVRSFMKKHLIIDIYMRMLDVDKELKPIQGFPIDYTLLGNSTQRKKFIGNSIVPLMACLLVKAVIEANLSKLFRV